MCVVVGLRARVWLLEVEGEMRRLRDLGSSATSSSSAAASSCSGGWVGALWGALDGCVLLGGTGGWEGLLSALWGALAWCALLGGTGGLEGEEGLWGALAGCALLGELSLEVEVVLGWVVAGGLVLGGAVMGGMGGLDGCVLLRGMGLE